MNHHRLARAVAVTAAAFTAVASPLSAVVTFK